MKAYGTIPCGPVSGSPRCPGERPGPRGTVPQPIQRGESWKSMVRAEFPVPTGLTSTEFKQLSTMVRQLKAIDPAYHLIFFNCNDFVGEAAESIGLRRPPSVMLPATYVGLLRALNEH